MAGCTRGAESDPLLVHPARWHLGWEQHSPAPKGHPTLSKVPRQALRDSCTEDVPQPGWIWQEVALHRQAGRAAHTKSWEDGAWAEGTCPQDFGWLFLSRVSSVWDTPGTVCSQLQQC